MPHHEDFEDEDFDSSLDDYDYKPVSSFEKKKSKSLKVLSIVVFIGVLAGGAWYFTQQTQNSDASLPVVRADTNPTKEKPTDPGGMTVPNRDKTVYENVRGSNSEPKLERLLPRPEKPLDLPKTAAILTLDEEQPSDNAPLEAENAEDISTEIINEEQQTNDIITEEINDLADTPTLDVVEDIEPPLAPALQIPTSETSENGPRVLTKRSEIINGPTQTDQIALENKIAEALGNAPSQKTASEVTVKDETSKTPENIVGSTSQTEIAAQSKGTSYFLQLLSSKSKSGVEDSLKKVQNDNKDILATEELNVVKADLGSEKGIYYRLRVGPIYGAEKAKSLCNSLKDRKIGCFLVNVQ